LSSLTSNPDATANSIAVGAAASPRAQQTVAASGFALGLGSALARQKKICWRRTGTAVRVSRRCRSTATTNQREGRASL